MERAGYRGKSHRDVRPVNESDGVHNEGHRDDAYPSLAGTGLGGRGVRSIHGRTLENSNSLTRHVGQPWSSFGSGSISFLGPVALDLHCNRPHNGTIPKHSRTDPILLAKKVFDRTEAETGKNPAAVALGKLGRPKGGRARAKALSAERRSEIARKAAATRWKRINQS